MICCCSAVQHMRLAGSGCVSPRDLDEAWPQLQAASLRDLALHDNARPDGRGSADVRLLQSVVGMSRMCTLCPHTALTDPILHSSLCKTCGSRCNSSFRFVFTCI